MKLLVLGGTRFVGRAVVGTALQREYDVTVLTRGVSGEPPDRVRWLRADRSEPGALDALRAEEWDAVIDTWDGDPAAVVASASALAGLAAWYGYVSSRSVYRWPPAPGSDESAPLVDVAIDDGYAGHKRAAELAVQKSFPDSCLLARAGLVVGPYEDTGRLTWWLQRAASGGHLVAPEPASQRWQLIDARDLAAFMLDAAVRPTTGAINAVGPRSEGLTTARLVEACVEVTGHLSSPVWVAPSALARAGVRAWDDLPGWVPPGDEAAGLHDCDVTAAVAAGLSCRPIEETVADTWAWMQTLPAGQRRPLRAGLPRRGLTAEQEQAIWWSVPRTVVHSI